MKSTDGNLARLMGFIAGLWALVMGHETWVRSRTQLQFLETKLDALRSDPPRSFDIPSQYLDVHTIDYLTPLAIAGLALAVYRLGRRIDSLSRPANAEPRVPHP